MKGKRLIKRDQVCSWSTTEGAVLLRVTILCVIGCTIGWLVVVLLLSWAAGTTFGRVEARLVGLVSQRWPWFFDGLIN